MPTDVLLHSNKFMWGSMSNGDLCGISGAFVLIYKIKYVTISEKKRKST